MENRYGRDSELNIEITGRGDRSIISDVYFTPPFKIMKPFYENGLMRVLQMSASPGVMEGDCQKINIRVGEGAKAEIYSQSFEKIHKMEAGHAVRHIDISVDKDSFFIYNPLPTIPYAGSAFKNTINVRLKDHTSVFIYEDMLISGRVAGGESFAYRYYQSLVNIYEDNTLTYRDNTLYKPDKMDMDGIGLYEGYTHLLGMVVCGMDIYDEISAFFDGYNAPWGITLNDRGYVVIRALGSSAQPLQKISGKIKELAYRKYRG